MNQYEITDTPTGKYNYESDESDEVDDRVQNIKDKKKGKDA